MTTTQRGYGSTHQQRRRMLIRNAYHHHCPICGDVMLPGQALDLDHTTRLVDDATSQGDRITHAACNRNGRGGQRSKTQTSVADPAKFSRAPGQVR